MGLLAHIFEPDSERRREQEMPTPIFFQQTATKMLDDGRTLFLIRLQDRDGQEYSWAPRWKDLHDSYLQAAQVERQNAKKDPEGFVTVARAILATADQRLQDAEVLTGKVERLAGGFLEVTPGIAPDLAPEGSTVRLPVAFEIDEDWLVEYVGRTVRCLVIGGAICRIRHIGA
jgi:hypothetical protein